MPSLDYLIRGALSEYGLKVPTIFSPNRAAETVAA
jgi:hypothetical protein